MSAGNRHDDQYFQNEKMWIPRVPGYKKLHQYDHKKSIFKWLKPSANGKINLFVWRF